MSLHIDLYQIDSEGQLRELVFAANITHNLNNMAAEAGFYKQLWGYNEEVTKAKHLIEPLEKGIADMVARPTHYKQFDASNGWGTYKDFLPWLANLLEACKAYPDATIHVSR